MITGIGLDMIEVARVSDKISRSVDFRNEIFSAREIAYCEAQPAAAEHYAARFAAKEAFLKACGVGLTLGYRLSEIEIIHGTDGRPELLAGGAWKELTFDKTIHVSITHLKTIASAVVILEKAL